jgi:ADP-heptose:LPS heptosyltransferase
MQKILVIQTAFIGDVVLATAIIEKLHRYFPNSNIDFLVRKGNEGLLQNNPHLHQILIWNKKEGKYKQLLNTIKEIRSNHYDLAINLQRFFTTGLITALSGAKKTIGFDKNPLSFLFTKKIKHIISTTPPYRHEVQRNNDLIAAFTDNAITKPKLYPSDNDFAAIQAYNTKPYITITPSSVWFTKQYPVEKWIALINALPAQYNIYILGGKDNITEAENIATQSVHGNATVLAGRLSFLQSAALMKTALMNYVNDSAPLHFASAVNAPVTALFCSTVPAFGFTPLSDKSFVIETEAPLPCRPCGLHGKKSCPQQHFKCGFTIDTAKVVATAGSI